MVVYVSGWTIDRPQAASCGKGDGGRWCVDVGIKEVLTNRIQRSDFKMSQGFRGKVQSIMGFKDNLSTATSPLYPIMEISNFLVGSDSNPYTYPTISNSTLLGGKYCSTGDLDYKDAIVILQNGNAQIYNSVLEGFDRYGLLLGDANVVSKTASGSDQLQFSNNSIHNVTTPFAAQIASTWAVANGCRLNSLGTMQDWIEGLAGVS